MSVTSGFLWRFLDDVWDLLPTKDRELFETYWMGMLQIGGDVESKAIEARISRIVEDMPVFLVDRWNRYQMTETNCDLLENGELLTLENIPIKLDVETALYHTFVLTGPSGSIQHVEQLEFFDSSIRSLRYGGIINGSVSVKISTVEYTENLDYVVNYVDGTIQALEDGRIPIDQLATILYSHEAYTKGLDYDLDEQGGWLSRGVNTTIALGGLVLAKYTYNTTPTVLLQGTNATIPVGRDRLIDAAQNFSGLLPGRTITVASGPNIGSYLVANVISATELAVATLFPIALVDGGMAYTINAFPHGQRIDKNIVSIPAMQDLLDSPRMVLQEGVDYIVSDGLLASRTAFPMQDRGLSEERQPTMWAEKTLVDKELPYRNFGVLIDFYRKNSEAYKDALQGLWFTFWTGSTTQNLQQGLHILLGLPYARRAGTVITLVAPTPTTTGTAQIRDERGQILSYILPTGLSATVAVGDQVDRFQSLTTGVKIIDRISEPGFVATRLGRIGIARFLTSQASTGPGDTDETKALELLEHHLFLPQVLSAALTSLINVAELKTFLDNMKPKWTEYIFSFNEDVDESISLDGAHEELDTEFGIDLTAKVGSNEGNEAWEDGQIPIDRATGDIPVGASQAAGNFRDLGISFIAHNVSIGDLVWINSGPNRGWYRVLEIKSANLLSLDIPDAAVSFQIGLSYILLPKEWDLGHDAVNLMKEHLVRVGANYLVPTTLNTKTDADLSNITDDDLKTLLLVDITNVGNEVQAITAASVLKNEFSVATPPVPPVATPHEISSASLVRRHNSPGPIVITDAFAI